MSKAGFVSVSGPIRGFTRLQLRGQEVHQVPIATGDGLEPVHSASALAKLGDAGAGQSLLGKVSQPLRGDVDRLVELPHAGQQCDQDLDRER